VLLIADNGRPIKRETREHMQRRRTTAFAPAIGRFCRRAYGKIDVEQDESQQT
jgi:hypothetical protein